MDDPRGRDDDGSAAPLSVLAEEERAFIRMPIERPYCLPSESVDMIELDISRPAKFDESEKPDVWRFGRRALLLELWLEGTEDSAFPPHSRPEPPFTPPAAELAEGERGAEERRPPIGWHGVVCSSESELGMVSRRFP